MTTKTTKFAADLIAGAHARLPRLAEHKAASAAAQDEFNAFADFISPYIAEMTPDYYQGLIDGTYNEIEDILHLTGQYNGYREKTVKHYDIEVTYRVYYMSDKIRQALA